VQSHWVRVRQVRLKYKKTCLTIDCTKKRKYESNRKIYINNWVRVQKEISIIAENMFMHILYKETYNCNIMG